ncbi:MAG: prepilin-type N-terminal cleavage/methylation domain-containing protein [Candidatus Omnitrophota bacterium]
MKKGFTLLELIVVIIILGILATLGFAQYGRMVERSRGAEARAVLGAIRTSAAAYRLENGAVTGFNSTLAGIGATVNEIPSACRSTHYFSYAVTGAGADNFTAIAQRCTSGGKTPDGVAGNITLASNFSLTGSDVWGGVGGY